MLCPMQLLIKDTDIIEGKMYQTVDFVGCQTSQCAWWNSKANFNPTTKDYSGECCVLTLSKLRVNGLISTHPA